MPTRKVRRDNIMQDPVKQEVDRKGARICPHCGAEFTCDLEAGKETCWCFEVTRLNRESLRPSMGCLCPKCLEMLADE